MAGTVNIPMLGDGAPARILTFAFLRQYNSSSVAPLPREAELSS
jgi:hypothetical protein